MHDVKIHSGTRVRLKKVDEAALPVDFQTRLRELAHADERIEAVFLCAIETEEQGEQLSLVVALREGWLARADEAFLQVVEQLRLALPPGLSFNLYRFGSSPELARWCVSSVEPVHLRTTAWLERQRKKLT